MRNEIEKYQSISNCESCSGFRLTIEALSVKINNIYIGQITVKHKRCERLVY